MESCPQMFTLLEIVTSAEQCAMIPIFELVTIKIEVGGEIAEAKVEGDMPSQLIFDTDAGLVGKFAAFRFVEHEATRCQLAPVGGSDADAADDEGLELGCNREAQEAIQHIVDHVQIAVSTATSDLVNVVAAVSDLDLHPTVA